VLVLVSLTAAASVWPGGGAIAGGLVPHLMDNIDYEEVLPWLRYALSGAAGLMWYSYWLTAKGYGAAGGSGASRERLDPKTLREDGRRRLCGWLRQMTLDTTVAVLSATLITVVFLILGAELLRPRGPVPADDRIADTLDTALSGVFGRFAYWFIIVGLLTGFFGTVLSNQDGFGRLIGNGMHLLLRSFGLQGRWTDEKFLKDAIVIGLVTLVPMGLFLLVGKPIGLLKVSGAIEAAHVPIVTGLTLYLNHRSLPPDLRPTWFTFAVTVLAGLFFVAFAAIYLFRLIA
jgi:Mn2+/Fe2+ NRAMP family transporter